EGQQETINSACVLIVDEKDPNKADFILNPYIVHDISLLLEEDSELLALGKDYTPDNVEPAFIMTTRLTKVTKSNGRWLLNGKVAFNRGLPEDFSSAKDGNNFIKDISKLSQFLDQTFFVNIEGAYKGKPTFRFDTIKRDATSIRFNVTFG